MKRLCCLLLCVLCCCSCGTGAEREDPLAFVRMPMTVSAHISCEAGNGRAVITFTDATHYTVRYTEPAVMEGVLYERDGEDAYLCFGQSRIPVSEGEACLGSLAAARLLIPNAAGMTADAANTLDAIPVRVCKFEDGTLTSVLYLSEDGVPLRIEGEADGFSATFTELEFVYN